MLAFNRRNVLLGFSGLFSVLAGGCVDISAGTTNYIDTEEKRFSVTGTPTLDLATFDGTVEVSTWDRPEVAVRIEKRAPDKAAVDRIVVEATQDGDLIRIHVRERRESGLHLTFGSSGARLTATVPATARIEASTGDGGIDVHDVAGDLRVRTGDGSIRIDGVRGTVDAESGDGSMEIRGTLQKLTARTGDGRVRVHAAEGSVASDDWSITTGDGSVTLEVPDRFDAELDASTGDGRIQLKDVAFSGSESHRRSAKGRLGAGGETIRIRTGDGSIVVQTDAISR